MGLKGPGEGWLGCCIWGIEEADAVYIWEISGGMDAGR